MKESFPGSNRHAESAHFHKRVNSSRLIDPTGSTRFNQPQNGMCFIVDRLFFINNVFSIYHFTIQF